MSRRTRGPLDWNDDERRRAFAVVAELGGSYPRHSDREKPRVRKSVWWTAYLRLALETGLSRRYLLKIRHQDINGAGVLTVRLRDPVRMASFKLSPQCLAAIESARWYDSVRRLLKIGIKLGGGCELWRDWRRIRRLAFSNWEQIRSCQTIGWTHPDVAELPPLGDISADSQMRTIDFYHRFYLLLKLRGRADRTQTLYIHSIRSFGRFLGRDALLSDFTDETVNRYLAWVASRQRSPYTVEKDRCQLLAIWRFACARHLVRDYPTIQKGRLPERAAMAWTQEELAKLFRAVNGLTGTIGTSKRSEWWRALLLVLYDTGERITAVLQLKWDHVDLEQGWLRIPAECRKGKTRDMVFRLHPNTVEAIKAIRRPRELIFAWPRSSQTIWYHLGEILKKAGLPADNRSKFHRLRRTVASHFEAAGGDATELLDHTSRTVTRRYLDARIVQRKHPSELLPRPDESDDKPKGKAG